VVVNENSLTITINNKNVIVKQISIFIDQYYIGSMSLTDTIVINTDGYKPKTVQIQSEVRLNGKLFKVNEIHSVRKTAFREPQYKPGDILVGCDNVSWMPYGYMGNILRINLSKKAISIEHPEDKFYRALLGGRGFIGYYLMKELKRNTDPLGPDNLLIFATFSAYASVMQN
jgi:hypothetical protein